MVLTTTQQVGTATTQVDMSGNLNASEPVVTAFTTAQLLADPSNSAISQILLTAATFGSLMSQKLKL